MEPRNPVFARGFCLEIVNFSALDHPSATLAFRMTRVSKPPTTVGQLWEWLQGLDWRTMVPEGESDASVASSSVPPRSGRVGDWGWCAAPRCCANNPGTGAASPLSTRSPRRGKRSKAAKPNAAAAGKACRWWTTKPSIATTAPCPSASSAAKHPLRCATEAGKGTPAPRLGAECGVRRDRKPRGKANKIPAKRKSHFQQP